MPTIEQNLSTWNSDYQWDRQGEEWSASWGGSAGQWFGSILPRIRDFVPTDTILEIAPGFGRWTNFLQHHCRTLMVVDLAEQCLEACRKRFTSASHISYHLNDGKSLAMIPDHSVDVVFSFDSLVHAEADVLSAYLTQLRHKLKPTGIGFVHHSNIGAYRRIYGVRNRLPGRLRQAMIRHGVFDQDHWRAPSMTAELFALACDQAGLRCISQERVNWETKRLIDCFSVFTQIGSPWDRPLVSLANPRFMDEAAQIKRLSRLYQFRPGSSGSPAGSSQ